MNRLPLSDTVPGGLAHDVRFALRLLGKSPGFTCVTVLTLALGIAGNTALFSLVDAVLLRPFPYPDSERLVVVWAKPPRGGISNISPANFLDLRDQNRVFEHMGAAMMAPFTVSIQGVAERLTGFRVNAGFFDALGVKAALGRTFTSDAERPGAPPLAMLSYAAWQRWFGGDPGVVGRTVTVDGKGCTIAGVLPDSFRFAYSPEMLLPIELDPANAPRDFHVLFSFAKLKPGISLAKARAEMDGLARNLARAYPKAVEGWGLDLWLWRDNFMGTERRTSLVLFGAVGFVLLVACVNLANLLLAKAMTRRRELAVRAAVGAGRGRLVRQLLTESLVLSLLGGLAGVLLAHWLVALVPALVPPTILTSIAEITVDWRVLAFALCLSVLTGLMFGLAPALSGSAVNLQDALKEAGRDAAGSSSGKRIRAALVVAELALSLTLLVGAGLMIRSLAAIHASDPGFRAANLLTLRINMPETRYADPARVRAFNRLLLERVKALPGVRAATLASYMPLEGKAIPMRFRIASLPRDEAPPTRESFQWISDSYFETLGIALRKGRRFTERDNESAPRVVIVNQAFVDRHLAGQEPLGHRLVLEERWVDLKPRPGASVPWEIVGVVADVKVWALHRGARPQIYGPLMQSSRPGGTLAVRTAAEPRGIARSVHAAVQGLDKDIPVTDVRTMQQIAAETFAQPRLHTWLIGIFAAFALALAALGIYSVISYSLAHRIHEMGIRMALGAHPGDLLRTTVGSAAVMVLLGLGLGLAGSLALARVLRTLLFEVQPTDPLTYIAVSALLLAVGLIAAYLPARRGLRVDPAAALRLD